MEQDSINVSSFLNHIMLLFLKKECFVKMRFMRLPESFASNTNKELELIVF